MAHKLTEVLAGQSTSELSIDAPQPSSPLAPSSRSENAMAWKVVRPKDKEGGQRLTSKTSLKPLKNKKVGFPSPASGGLSTSPQALTDTQSFDMLATCAHCNILLPLPTLWKHEVRSHTLDMASCTRRAVPAESLLAPRCPSAPLGVP